MILLEANTHLGGRASSFVDPETGEVLDNSQHILLGCCSHMIGFLATIGSVGRVEFHHRIRMLDAGGRTLEIRRSALPPPLHLLPCVLHTRYLSFAEKLALGQLLVRVMCWMPGKSDTAEDYLRTLRCPEAVVRRVIEPILISALNESIYEASAKYARMVLLESLTADSHGYQIGVPNVPLAELIEKPAEEYLLRRNCEIRKGARAVRIGMEDNIAHEIALACGENIACDAVVSAVPPGALVQMNLPASGGEHLIWQPIISVHVFLNEPLPIFEPVCMAQEPFQWIFAHRWGNSSLGYAQVVASAAGPLMELSDDQLADMAARTIVRAIPEVSKLNLRSFRILRHRNATFSTCPESDICRPSQMNSASNVFIAGDWTATGWPATMEGAVRSGEAAAKAIITYLE